jgi:hypothetical protein
MIKDEENKFKCEQVISKNRARLDIDFEGEEKFTLKKLKIRVSKNLPHVGYYNRYSVRNFIFFPWITIDITPEEPRVNSGLEFYIEELSTKEKFCIDLPVGEYYVSLDNLDSDRIDLNPIESKLILFTFGYGFYLKREYRKDYDYDSFFENEFIHLDISDFDQDECIYGRNKYFWDGDRTGKEISECPKLKLKEGSPAKITIQLGKRETNSSETVFFKIFPGIIILAPFTNSQGYFYRRNYTINLKN